MLDGEDESTEEKNKWSAKQPQDDRKSKNIVEHIWLRVLYLGNFTLKEKRVEGGHLDHPQIKQNLISN